MNVVIEVCETIIMVAITALICALAAAILWNGAKAAFRIK